MLEICGEQEIHKTGSFRLPIQNIIFDLHGVLVKSENMKRQYNQIIANFLHRDFNLSIIDAQKNHQKAFNLWLQKVNSWSNLQGEILHEHHENALLQWVEDLLEGVNNLPNDLMRYATFIVAFCCDFNKKK